MTRDTDAQGGRSTADLILNALAAISVAEASYLDALGTAAKLDILEWARQTAAEAFRALDEAYWQALDPSDEATAPTRETLDQASNLVAEALSRTLLANGYQPPPSIGQLIHETRQAVERGARTPEARKKAVRQARAATEELGAQLSAPQSASQTRGLLARAKKALAGALIPLILPAAVGAAVDDVYDTAKAAAVHVLKQSDEPDGTSDQHQEAETIGLQKERAELRRAEAEAAKAEAEAKVAELRLSQMQHDSTDATPRGN